MMESRRITGRVEQRVLLAVLGLWTISVPAVASTYAVKYTFTGSSDGGVPYSGLVRDTAGNLYGQNTSGAGRCPNGPTHQAGCGVVYKLDAQGHETTLVTYTGANGLYGHSQLLLLGDTLYGTAGLGGSKNLGLLFSVKTNGSDFTILHQFSGADGAYPSGALRLGPGPVLYGVTNAGGPAYNAATSTAGDGVLFELRQDGSYVTLHDFTGGADYQNPVNILVNSAGVIFGDAGYGARVACNYGANCGVVYQYVAKTGAFVVLHTFTGYDDLGDLPGPQLGSIGPDGTVYGATFKGGTGKAGTLFSLTPSGTSYGFATLFNFSDSTSSSLPSSGPVISPSGALTGTSNGVAGGSIYSFSNNQLNTLYTFPNTFGPTGSVPAGGVSLTKSGLILGVAEYGGKVPCPALGGSEDNGCGVVFSLQP